MRSAILGRAAVSRVSAVRGRLGALRNQPMMVVGGFHMRNPTTESAISPTSDQIASLRSGSAANRDFFSGGSSASGVLRKGGGGGGSKRREDGRGASGSRGRRGSRAQPGSGADGRANTRSASRGGRRPAGRTGSASRRGSARSNSETGGGSIAAPALVARAAGAA